MFQAFRKIKISVLYLNTISISTAENKACLRDKNAALKITFMS